jgi:hypothetical protein
MAGSGARIVWSTVGRHSDVSEECQNAVSGREMPYDPGPAQYREVILSIARGRSWQLAFECHSNFQAVDRNPSLRLVIEVTFIINRCKTLALQERRRSLKITGFTPQRISLL